MLGSIAVSWLFLFIRMWWVTSLEKSVHSFQELLSPNKLVHSGLIKTDTSLREMAGGREFVIALSLCDCITLCPGLLFSHKTNLGWDSLGPLFSSLYCSSCLSQGWVSEERWSGKGEWMDAPPISAACELNYRASLALVLEEIALFVVLTGDKTFLNWVAVLEE